MVSLNHILDVIMS